MDCKQLNHSAGCPAGSMLVAALAVVLALATPAQALPPEQLGAAEPAYERGAHLLRKGKVEEAIPALARAAELAPNVPDVLRLYVQALLVAGDTERAREQLDRLVAQGVEKVCVVEELLEGMICTELHRRRLVRRLSNPPSGSRESQPRRAVAQLVCRHHVVRAQEHNLQGHRRRHLTCEFRLISL